MHVRHVYSIWTTTYVFYGISLCFEEKYITIYSIICRKMKQKKYVHVGCARKPTAAALAKALFTKQPSRIGYLRPDTLSLMLNLANVGPFQRVLIIEGSSGLVTGAVAERLGGYGEISVGHFGKKPTNISLSNHFNFSNYIRDTIKVKSIKEMLEEVDGFAPKPYRDEDMDLDTAPREQQEENDIATLEKSQEAKEDTNGTRSDKLKEASKEVPQESERAGFNCVIVSHQSFTPKSALISVMPLLAPSATFVLAFHQNQPLADCMNLLKQKNLAVNMMFSEPFWREIQVLPQRTHPLMNMNHGGWYLLSGSVTQFATRIDLNSYRSSN